MLRRKTALFLSLIIAVSISGTTERIIARESERNTERNGDNIVIQAAEAPRETVKEYVKEYAKDTVKETEEEVVKEAVVIAEDEVQNREPEIMGIDEDSFNLLCKIVEAEAKGEPYDGKIAVVNVILNRVNNKTFPSTIKGVILQRRQFDPVTKGTIHNEDPSPETIKAVKEALEGKTVVSEKVVYFYNPKLVSRGAWIRSRPTEKKIGGHSFAR